MGAHVQCPRCEQAYALSEEQALLYAGKEFECAQCTLKFIIPASSAKAQNHDAPTTLRGELPRDPLTAAAVRSPAGMALPYPTFGMELGGGSGAAPPVPPPPTAYEPPPPQRSAYLSIYEDDRVRSSRLAAASMIFGIIGLLVPIVPGAIAILLGLIATWRIYRGKATGASLAAGGVAIGAAGMLLSGAIFMPRILPAIDRMRYAASSQALCVDHFRAIERALQDHAAANDGKFPDSVADLVESGALKAEALICPAGSDTKAVGLNAAETAARIRNGGHCSYIYVGMGLTKTAPQECVLLYEPMNVHRDEGIRVLFVDGRIEKIGKIEAARAVERLSRGMNPPWTVGKRP